MWQVLAISALCFLLVGIANGQESAIVKNVEKTANYDKQAISISYEGDGLPAFGFLNGTVQELDEIPSTIMLNKTKATLNCSSGFMAISLQFQQPFFGIVYADYDRNR